MLYASELRDIDVEVLGNVVDELMRTAARFPSMAEIREAKRLYLIRLRDEREGLPAGGESSVRMPPKVKEIVDALAAKMEERAKELEAS